MNIIGVLSVITFKTISTIRDKKKLTELGTSGCRRFQDSFPIRKLRDAYIIPDRRQSKTLLTIYKRESKIAVNGVYDFPQGDKWQSKTLFLTVFNLRSSIETTFSIPPIRCVYICMH